MTRPVKDKYPFSLQRTGAQNRRRIMHKGAHLTPQRGVSTLAAVLVLFVGLCPASAGSGTHKYALRERVDLWVNTIGPYHNPHETYPYYQLPFCKPDTEVKTVRKRIGLGEVLEGHELRNSGYLIQFGEDVEKEKLCTLRLNKDETEQFKSAVDQQYWYEMFLDDLPMWGMVGERFYDPQRPDDIHHFVFTHRKFSIGFNHDRVIEVNLTSSDPQELIPGESLEFTYSVKWKPTSVLFEKRFDRYLEYEFFEHQIHWFSIFNSFMMVIFLCGLVVLILLRTLKNDFAKYAKGDEESDGIQVLGEDSGWKQVHGDVFRAPQYLPVFAAMVGTGWQFVVLVLGVILFAMLGPLHGEVHEERGEITFTIIVCYALTAAVAGFASGSYYRQYFSTPRAEHSSQWQRVMLLTMLLFPTVTVTIALGLNFLAIYYDTSNAIPFTAMLKMLALWIFVALPLCVVGTLLGRHWASKPSFPCRVNRVPRPIPTPAWYASPYFVIPAAGVLPFGSIFIEMYFIFTSFWNYKFYYVYGFMLLVYLILMVVVICTTIVAVYFVLNSENYHWQWISFASSGCTAGYVFLYSIYYFMYKTQMTGLLQVSFYFGNMFLFCVGMFLLCGTVGVWGASLFVRRIYQHVKID